MKINMLDILKIHDKYLDSIEKTKMLTQKLKLTFEEVQNHELNTKEHTESYNEYLQVVHDITYENGYQKGLEKALNILGFEATEKIE